ncbi:MAG: hypothetical protein FWF91_02050 [Coriobacteriia bacterium]|nr:hypothetical protein [Coriobacteriia bacterium]
MRFLTSKPGLSPTQILKVRGLRTPTAPTPRALSLRVEPSCSRRIDLQPATSPRHCERSAKREAWQSTQQTPLVGRLSQRITTHFALRSILQLVIALLLIIAATPTTALADAPTPTTALADAPTTTIDVLLTITEQDDSQDVTVVGEAIGDIINARQSDYKWLLLNHEGASISVYVSAEDASRITHLGRYNQVGTLIEVSGEFRVECAEHEGLTDIHATSITILDEGHSVASPFSSRKLQIGAALILVGAALLVLHWRLRERTR